MISFILISLAAICNSIMDILQFHYKKSIFIKFNPQWWNPAISWKNKYIDWDNGVMIEKKIHIFNLFSIKYPIFLTDAWHLFKSSMIVLFGLGVVFYSPVINPFIDIIIIGLVWNLTFNVFYNKIFRKN